MCDPHDHNQQFSVVDSIQNSIIAHSNAVFIFLTCYLDHPRRPGGLGQFIQPPKNALSSGGWQFANLFLRRSRNANGVGHEKLVSRQFFLEILQRNGLLSSALYLLYSLADGNHILEVFQVFDHGVHLFLHVTHIVRQAGH
jgi:hypothetical protein